MPLDAVEVRAEGRRVRRSNGHVARTTGASGFVQWEFAGRLGPPRGRYVVRRFAGDDVRQVIVVTELGAPRRRAPPAARARRPRRPRSRRSTRVTVIDADAAGGRRRTGCATAAAATDGRAALARLVAAHRVAAADPLAPDPDPARALVARGSATARGEQVADGRAGGRRTSRPAARRRSGAAPPVPGTAPAERLAALLSARDAALACEELTLRARADLDRGRHREAALQLEAALAAALAELAGLGDDRATSPRASTSSRGYAAGASRRRGGRPPARAASRPARRRDGQRAARSSACAAEAAR